MHVIPVAASSFARANAGQMALHNLHGHEQFVSELIVSSEVPATSLAAARFCGVSVVRSVITSSFIGALLLPSLGDRHCPSGRRAYGERKYQGCSGTEATGPLTSAEGTVSRRGSPHPRVYVAPRVLVRGQSEVDTSSIVEDYADPPTPRIWGAGGSAGGRARCGLLR